MEIDAHMDFGITAEYIIPYSMGQKDLVGGHIYLTITRVMEIQAREWGVVELLSPTRFH